MPAFAVLLIGVTRDASLFDIHRDDCHAGGSERLSADSMASVKARRSGSFSRIASKPEVSSTISAADPRNATHTFDALEAVPHCASDGLCLGLAGQPSELGGQRFGLAAADIECRGFPTPTILSTRRHSNSRKTRRA